MEAGWERLRQEFPIRERHVFLNHAGVGPTSLRAAGAVSRFMGALAHLGRPDFDAWEAVADRCREQFAALVGAGADEIAFVRNTSHGLSLVAAGLGWRPGDRVAVATSVEYPSNVYPWLDLAERGVVVVDDVPAPEGVVTPEAVAASLRPETRLVAVSSAQYGSGAVTDLAGLGAVCRDRDVLLCVDGIQTVGAMPVDVKGAGIHFLSADSHKWMLGIMGIGAVFVDREAMADLRPALVGWRSTSDAFNFDRVHFELAPSAGRYEEGSLPYPLIAGFVAALEILDEVGMDRCISHIEGLIGRLADGLESLGCHIGPEPSVRRHILTASHPEVAPEILLDRLHQRRVVASVRRGSLRLSPHFYNTTADIDVVLETVEEAVRPRA